MSQSTITTEEKTTAKPSSFASRPVRSNGREVETKVEAEPTGPPRGLLREYFESAVVTVIMALFGMTFIVQAVKVPTGSMQNTIVVGDHLLVNKFIFAPGPRLPLLPQREIRRGDIIVFKYPGNPFNPERDRDEDNIPFKVNYVKRVIGLPGDVVEVKGLRVFVNGQPLPEHIIVATTLMRKRRWRSSRILRDRATNCMTCITLPTKSKPRVAARTLAPVRILTLPLMGSRRRSPPTPTL